MNDIPFLADHAQLSLRWGHVIAGVLWIGMLWFFNWVNSAFAPTMDGDTKRKVVPELMPRALFWFRWGAAYTWVLGALLLFVMYYIGPTPNAYGIHSEHLGANPAPAVWGQAFVALLVGFFVYDQLFKVANKINHSVAVLLWAALAVAYGWYLENTLGFSGRATMVHVAALFGTSMAANVWMRIWPAQQRIITAIKNGEAPEGADVALAGLRSKHNTYMSMPLLLFMVGVDQAALNGATNLATVWIPVSLVIGFVITWALYRKAPQVPGF
ncbi:MAG: urate hydroxylase PuuD [Planctomycetota bacterium]|jgi:uncharacterized membrane protein|nr:urate hydroxylase PuuD [Planctomycetota bacterium]MDP6763966.1 urate hydroxylase PuuD [Planctomycetota bacterium]MDP6990126.1 urate hydroxylase PuuD [Planctomycetota bacterium]